MIEVLLLADPLDGNDRLERRVTLGSVPRVGDTVMLDGDQTHAKVEDAVFYPEQIPEIWVRLESYNLAELYEAFGATKRYRSAEVDRIIDGIDEKISYGEAPEDWQDVKDWITKEFMPHG